MHRSGFGRRYGLACDPASPASIAAALRALLDDCRIVVPEGLPEKWSHAPFAADIADGFIFGRGAGGTTCPGQKLYDKLGTPEAVLHFDIAP